MRNSVTAMVKWFEAEYRSDLPVLSVIRITDGWDVNGLVWVNDVMPLFLFVDLFIL